VGRFAHALSPNTRLLEIYWLDANSSAKCLSMTFPESNRRLPLTSQNIASLGKACDSFSGAISDFGKSLQETFRAILKGTSLRKAETPDDGKNIANHINGICKTIGVSLRLLCDPDSSPEEVELSYDGDRDVFELKNSEGETVFCDSTFPLLTTFAKEGESRIVVDEPVQE
jgi:hypothetical protein